jgi:hypothetical protein
MLAKFSNEVMGRCKVFDGYEVACNFYSVNRITDLY